MTPSVSLRIGTLPRLAGAAAGVLFAIDKPPNCVELAFQAYPI
jgi:hypothetical protein